MSGKKINGMRVSKFMDLKIVPQKKKDYITIESWYCSILYQKIMSHNFNLTRKTDSRSRLRQLRDQSSIGFQTCFKFRSNHTLAKSPITKQKCLTEQQQQQQNQPQQKSQLLIDSQLGLESRTFSTKKEEILQKSKVRLSEVSYERKNLRMAPSHSHATIIQEKCGQDSVGPLETLENLERKIQELLEMKLVGKARISSFSSFLTHDDELEKDLQALLIQLRQYSANSDNQLNSDITVDIKELTQRIGILEKIIAQSFTESQMLKKYYFVKKMSRKTFCVFDPALRKSYGEDTMPEIRKKGSLIPQHPSLHFTTISQQSYKKPSPDAYRKSLSCPKKVLHNLQNMPRSLYQSDYLDYGSLPVYPKAKKELTSLSGLKSLQKNSLYKTDFSQKRAQRMDSTSLDCRKDKIIPRNINYISKSLLAEKQNFISERKRKIDGIKKIASIKQQVMYEEPKIITSSFAHIYKEPSAYFTCGIGAKKTTEYQSKFMGEKLIMECLAKEKNLSNLKYELKKQTKA